MPTELDLLKEALAMIMALKQTLVSADLEAEFEQHLHESRKLLRAAHGAGILRELNEQNEDTSNETSED